jgi:uncharacterized protein with HEPN domain
MPSRSDPKRHLLDIRDNILLARKFVQDMSLESFCQDQLVFYATVRCLEIISEVSRRLPDELKSRHPSIPWADIAAAGNVYRHDYEDVQHRLVWGTLHNRLPELLTAVEKELE